MNLLTTLEAKAEAQDLSFLVIGGLAVIHYGYPRDTGDLDLLILRDRREQWLALFSELQYAVFQDRNTFLQLSPPATGAWPVDLMLAGETTFDEMLAASLEVEMLGARLRIPSLEHLLALKLHALKHGGVHRHLKDFIDVEGLVMANNIDLETEKIRALFTKYGNMELYEKIRRACSNR